MLPNSNAADPVEATIYPNRQFNKKKHQDFTWANLAESRGGKKPNELPPLPRLERAVWKYSKFEDTGNVGFSRSVQVVNAHEMFRAST